MGSRVSVTSVSELFPTRLTLDQGAAVAMTWGYARMFDLSADGQRFLVNRPVEELEVPPIAVLTDWRAALLR